MSYDQKREAIARIQCWQLENTFHRNTLRRMEHQLEFLKARIEALEQNIENERKSVEEETK